MSPLWGHVTRLFLYPVWFAALAWLVSAEGYREGTASLYKERSLLEFSHTACLLITAMLFLASARLTDHWRALCVSFTFAALMAVVREQNFFLDHYVFDGAWQTIVFGLAIGLAVYLWRHGRGLGAQIVSFAETRCAGLLAAGFLVVFVFSRLFGRQSFWQAIMGDGYQRVVKNVAEEGVELLGYGLLVMAAAESWFYLRDRRRQVPAQAG